MEFFRKLPVGIQSFENIRTDGYVYVDKTEYIYNLVNTGKTYFLSRPRRFGKSLLLSTMKAYFEGRRELFEGLKIAELEKDWTKYPVLHFDFADKSFSDEKDFVAKIDQILRRYEEKYGRDEGDGDDVELRFNSLIKNAAQKTGQKVVVLVDEYDKSLLEADNEFLEKMRKIYRGVFGSLKSMDSLIKFVFITGITKFSQTNIFSGLNQLNDISLYKDYSALCGITQKEMESNFSPEIDTLAEENNMTREECLAKLKKMYDGYLFSKKGEKVYNPFSLINALKSRSFDSWWFGTATPTMLIRSLEKNNFDPIEFDNGELAIQGDELSDYRVDSSNPVPLFYQSGYLTIKGWDEDVEEYTLGYPNDEVKFAFLKRIVPLMTSGAADSYSALEIGRFKKEIEAGDIDAFMKRFEALFSALPYPTEGGEKKLAVVEQNFQNMFYIVFMLLGKFVEVETPFAHGRSDCILKTDKYIYIFEFKLDESADAALRQIEEKGYASAFATNKRKLFKVGVNLSREKRNIDEWKVI